MLNPQVESTNNQLKDITEKFNSGFDIGIIAFLFHKSRIFILLFFALSFFLTFLYLRYSQPVYESRAVIQINDANQADDILKLNNLGNNGNVLAEAVEQIRSKAFLKRVVEKLDISVNYYSEGTFKNSELYHSSPYQVKINSKEGAVFGQKINVELNKEFTGGVMRIGKKSIPFVLNSWVKTPDFDINIFLNQRLSPSVIKEIVQENNGFYFVVHDVDAVTTQLQSKVELKILNDLAKTILIRVKDVNPFKSTDVVNAITEEYLSYDVERKSESSRNIISFIDSQLGSVYNDLKNTEGDLQAFKKAKNIGDKDQLINTELMRYSTVEDQMLKIEMEERIIAEIQENISRNKNIDIYQLISMISGTEYENVVKGVTQQIQKLLNDKEILLYAVTPNAENIKQINYQLETQKKLLLESLDAVRLKYKSKYKSLLEKYSDFKSRLNKSPEDEVELSRLTRLYSIREKYYTMLLEKKTEFSISKAGYVTKNIILEKAMGLGVQVSPSRRNAIMIAFLVSLLFSVGLVFIR
jgi:tyrosine-protein kinase Etk/Wzc